MVLSTDCRAETLDCLASTEDFVLEKLASIDVSDIEENKKHFSNMGILVQCIESELKRAQFNYQFHDADSTFIKCIYSRYWEMITWIRRGFPMDFKGEFGGGIWPTYSWLEINKRVKTLEYLTKIGWPMDRVRKLV